MAKYYIYRNLRTGGFSVKYRGIVIDRFQSAIAENVVFKVNRGGRELVLKNKQKNVHAYVVVDKYIIIDNIIDHLEEIKYNPYKNSYFEYLNNPINGADRVAFSGGKCFKGK